MRELELPICAALCLESPQFGPLVVILNHNFRETPHRWHVTAIIRSAADSAR
jgi:hypothetical protein